MHAQSPILTTEHQIKLGERASRTMSQGQLTTSILPKSRQLSALQHDAPYLGLEVALVFSLRRGGGGEAH